MIEATSGASRIACLYPRFTELEDGRIATSTVGSGTRRTDPAMGAAVGFYRWIHIRSCYCPGYVRRSVDAMAADDDHPAGTRGAHDAPTDSRYRGKDG